MSAEKVREELIALGEAGNADFQAKLAPTIKREVCLGIRLPNLRKYAKELNRREDREAFLADLPHRYLDENLLHAILLGSEKNYDACIRKLDVFLPYVDNWAVSDTLAPKVIAKRPQETIKHIRRWAASEETYTCRVGLGLLMRYYLDDFFDADYLQIPASIVSDEYYVNMMIAWFMATALAKQWDATIPYLQENRLPKWVHNKTIQKARESYRITPEQKEYLNTLKRK